jgi:hypothetical protein
LNRRVYRLLNYKIARWLEFESGAKGSFRLKDFAALAVTEKSRQLAYSLVGQKLEQNLC